MILSDYERKDSPWVWIQFTGADGKEYEKTNVRKNDPEREAKVALVKNAIQRRLLLAEPAGETLHIRETWNWVIPWLRTKYAAKSKQKTLKVYLTQWNWVSIFLAENEVASPALLTREHVFEYIDWRRAQVKKSSGKTTKLNTALGEVKMLGMIMKEAITRGYAAAENPAVKLGVEREDADETAAMTDEEIPIVFSALQMRPVWMQRSFFVAYHTGLRFSTTQIHRDQMRWALREILILKPKGGKKREFKIPIYPAIEPLLREWWASGEPWLWSLPPKERAMTGIAWWKFFKEIGLPHLEFHSTRTTFITRGALGDQARGIPTIPEPVMMKLVNHAKTEVHRIYQRFTTSDLHVFAKRMALPELVPSPIAADAKVESPHQKSGPPSSAVPA